jgi:putative ABC transport system permease protein
MDALLRDFRHGARSLRRSPGFTVLAVLTLALGIGATTAIFSVVDGVLLRPAPFDESDRLAMIWETDRRSGTIREPASFPDYLDFRERNTHFEELAAFTGLELNLVPDTGDPLRLAALAVSREFLPMVGIRPLLGRMFTEDEDQARARGVALIGEALWDRLFSRNPAALGGTIRLDDEAHTIVGVLPAGADFGVLQVFGASAYQRTFADRGGSVAVDVWVPLQSSVESYPRHTHPFFVMGRLAPGAEAAAAQHEMSAIAADLERTYPENAGRGVFVEPLSEVVFGPARPALLVLLSAVALVLLVACVNVANLLLARGIARTREIAVRSALGAGSGQLARQFLVESALLSGTAAAIAIWLAVFGMDVLRAFAPVSLPRVSLVGIDQRVLLTMLGVSLAVALFFGLLPAWQARRIAVRDALHGDAGRTLTAGREHRRARATLVVVQLALAVVLMVGAGLLIKSLWLLQRVDPGFDTTGLLKAEYQLPASRYPRQFARPEVRRFHDGLTARLEAMPGVQAVAIAGNHPLDAGFTNSFAVIGREAEARDWPEISVRRVSGGYPETVGVPLLLGRTFRPADQTPDLSGLVALINEAARQRFFPGQDPLEQRIALWGADWRIVGVVGSERIHGLHEGPPPAIYLPLGKVPSRNGSYSLLVRFVGDSASVAAAVHQTVRQLDPALPLFGVEPLGQTVKSSIGQQRFTTVVLGSFAAVALLLAGIGVYGVLSHAVAMRTREIGIRLAVGAGQRDVLRLMLGDGFALAATGAAFGVLAALALTRLLEGLLFGVNARDPWILVAVPLLLIGVALLASYLPCRRASRVDPVVALRGE